MRRTRVEWVQDGWYSNVQVGEVTACVWPLPRTGDGKDYACEVIRASDRAHFYRRYR